MSFPIAAALRILGHFWLEEVRASDLETISALPELAQTLPNLDATALPVLAVEFQRLFGFNVPPYESVFLDPSAMLMAPATERVQATYQQELWSPPAGIRSGAPDHLGLELLALADSLEANGCEALALASSGLSLAPGEKSLANRLHTQHLALWVPAFVLSLRRLAPHPFYATLGDLTLDLILDTLPDDPLPSSVDPFPVLIPSPGQTGSDGTQTSGLDSWELSALQDVSMASSGPDPDESTGTEEMDGDNVSVILRRLLFPCQAGLYLTREDLALVAQTLRLPAVVGERRKMLESLSRLARQYDQLPDLFKQLSLVLAEANQTYQTWAAEFQAWRPYAQAWCHRLASTQKIIEELQQQNQ